MERKWTLEEIDREIAAFDWSRVDAMTDEELKAAWAWDKDAVWPTEEELKQFRRVAPEPARRDPPRDAAE